MKIYDINFNLVRPGVEKKGGDRHTDRKPSDPIRLRLFFYLRYGTLKITSTKPCEEFTNKLIQLNKRTASTYRRKAVRPRLVKVNPLFAYQNIEKDKRTLVTPQKPSLLSIILLCYNNSGFTTLYGYIKSDIALWCK